MMKTSAKHIPLVAALASVLATFGPSAAHADEKTVDFSGTSSGSFASSRFQFNTSSLAILSTASGKDNIGGQFNVQSIAQYFFGNDVGPDECNLQDGTPGGAFQPYPLEGVIADGNSVVSYNQGQVYLKMVDAETTVGCQGIDGRFEIDMTYEIVGGTGRYENATGEWLSLISGRVLAMKNNSGAVSQFGGFEEIHIGTITY